MSRYSLQAEGQLLHLFPLSISENVGFLAGLFGFWKQHVPYLEMLFHPFSPKVYMLACGLEREGSAKFATAIHVAL